MSPRLKKAFQDIDWVSYQKSRDYIVHEYFNLQHDAFLEKSIDEIPQLETRIDQVLESIN
ncbi:MAG: hypothetical protein OXE55_06200 [Flavobacteriaceae bacterium]|nr:hypothetical protein [Flavobacteriaceae bacterium]MCY4253232.1 hypothetical protein [Flavobacteriaceae bacterium]